MAKYASVNDYEREAKQKLPRGVYGYYRSGADDERTLRENKSAFSRFLCDLFMK